MDLLVSGPWHATNIFQDRFDVSLHHSGITYGPALTVCDISPPSIMTVASGSWQSSITLLAFHGLDVEISGALQNASSDGVECRQLETLDIMILVQSLLGQMAVHGFGEPSWTAGEDLPAASN